MLIAAFAADGVTEIGNVRHIDRGYERIDERLRTSGQGSSARTTCPSAPDRRPVAEP